MSKNHLIWGFDSFKRPISFRFFSRNPLEIQIQIISKDPEGGVLIGWSCLEGLKFYSESVIHKKMWGLWNRDAKKRCRSFTHFFTHVLSCGDLCLLLSIQRLDRLHQSVSKHPATRKENFKTEKWEREKKQRFGPLPYWLDWPVWPVCTSVHFCFSIWK